MNPNPIRSLLQNKQVAATVETDQSTAICATFAEAQRRNPEHRRTWDVVIVPDLIHVQDYL